MGGHGSLRITGRHSDKLAAVVALEPALDPALQLDEVTERPTFLPDGAESGGDASTDRLVGLNRYAALFQANNPANVPLAKLMRFAEAVLRSILKPPTTMSSIFMTAQSLSIG